MSQFPTEPPLARLAPDASPPPPPEATPWPPAGSPSGYSVVGSVTRPRPGLLTALGVTSIVSAVLGAIVSLGVLVMATGFYAAAKAADSAIANRSRTATPPAFLAPPQWKIVVGPDGLDDARRRVAVDAMASLRRLPRRRAEQLDALLARAGRKILAVQDAAPLTPEAVRGKVVDHGELFAGGRRAAPPEFFKTAAGRVEVSDERAVFYPEDGSQPVRSVAPSTAGPTPLTAEQVQAVVKQAQASGDGSRLNAAQVSGLSAVLTMPNQRLAQASSGLAAEPRAVTIHPGGGATIRFTGGELHLGPGGQILASAPVAHRPAVNPAAFATTTVALLASVALSVLLLVAGILLLRDEPGRSAAGRRLHQVWAGLKVVVAVAVGAALWSMLDSFARAVAGTSAATTSGAQFAASLSRAAHWLVAAAVAPGILYAVGVLVTLATRPVREFYHPAD